MNRGRRPVQAADGDDIGHDDFERADRLRSTIAQIVEQRESYIRKNNLDPAFCLPDANWRVDGKNDFLNAYRHTQCGGYDVLNRLRFWTQLTRRNPIVGSDIGSGIPGAFQAALSFPRRGC